MVNGDAGRHRRLNWHRIQQRVERIGFYLLVLLVALPAAFVFFWMLTLSVKTQVESTAYPPIFIPRAPTLRAYAEVFAKNPFYKYTVNSLVVGLGSTILALAVGLPAAYSIARWKQQRLALGILVARMTPGLSYLVPWFIMFKRIGLTDNYLSLILTHLIISLPLVIWVMIGFFEDLPSELEDAARVDGCTTFGFFRRIALPLTQPGIVATAILSFIFSWNNFFVSVIIAGPNTRTLPVAVFNMMTYEEINWGPLAAAATMVTLPVLIMTLFMQRQIVSGLTFGAVKG